MSTNGRRDTRRRFEQWARNPLCDANTISAVRGIPMAEIASREGLRPTMGQSPFALAGGRTFESSLFRAQALRVREALVAAGVLPDGSSTFTDLRIRMSGGPLRDLDQAIDRTRDLLGEMAKRRDRHATLIAGATLSIPGNPMLPEAVLVLDALVARADQDPPSLVVGEVKYYPDRDGFTDHADLAGARAQAGVYVHGLRLVLQEMGLDGRVVVQDEGFLVLVKPGSRRPSVRVGEDLRFQSERARRGIDRLRGIAERMKACSEEEAIENALSAKIAYQATCVSFCDRAAGCFKRGWDSGDPVVLGEDVARFLGNINLSRAAELLNGAPVQTDAERDFVRRTREVIGVG